MRILRDLYEGLSPLERVMLLLTIVACLLIGFFGRSLDGWREIPRGDNFTAPPFEMRTAVRP